jgi:hypothetical protein
LILEQKDKPFESAAFLLLATIHTQKHGIFTPIATKNQCFEFFSSSNKKEAVPK